MVNGPPDPKKKKTVLYIGKDSSYWGNIKTRYQTSYAALDFQFEQFDHDLNEYQSIFLKVLEMIPGIIYIDLSEERDITFRLAQLLKRDMVTREIVLVGLVDKKEILRECISAGMNFIHVKCPEYHDVVFDPMKVAYPKSAKKPQFAKAILQRDSEIIDDFKIGYISPTGIHVEANCALEKGQVIEVESEIPHNIVPSKKFMVRERFESNLYYDYKYAYELDFKFVDEPSLDEGDEDDVSDEVKDLKAKDQDIKTLMAEYETELAHVKKRVGKWVTQNTVGGEPKKTKILVIDPNMNILKASSKPLDQYPYAIRISSILSEDLDEINRIRPSIVVYQLFEFKGEIDDTDMTEEEKEFYKQKESASLNTLGELIKMIHSIDKYNPFLVLFNCTKYTSKSFQDSFKYQLVLTNKESVNLDLVLEMADLYEQKQNAKTKQLIDNKIAVLKKENPAKYGRLKPADFQEKRYYVRKSSTISNASTKYPISITEISESEMIITSEYILGQANYRMEFPTALSISLIPDETGKLYTESKGLYTYNALVHAIGEHDKKKVRQFVNEIFFSDLNEQRRKEFEEFQNLNQKVGVEQGKIDEEEEESEDLEEGDASDDDSESTNSDE